MFSTAQTCEKSSPETPEESGAGRAAVTSGQAATGIAGSAVTLTASESDIKTHSVRAAVTVGQAVTEIDGLAASGSATSVDTQVVRASESFTFADTLAAPQKTISAARASESSAVTLSRSAALDSVRRERKAAAFAAIPELRGVWVSTVEELDWPMGTYDEEGQKELYRRYLDMFEKLNINAVFFQVRPLADAFYDSCIEPWCASITSERGRDPGYDVLRFLIDETHARGMQFHAWMNPYRIAKREGPGAEFPPLEHEIPAGLTLDYAKVRIYNPALPKVRERIGRIITDLMSRYDVDGIHFDDYFYPALQAGESMGDEKYFRRYGEGEADIEEFRRHNVEKMVRLAREAVKKADSTVIFSISPAGNYEYCRDAMYFDIEDICRKGLVDMIIPQLYWSQDAPVDYFTPRLQWFSEHTAGIPMLIGYAAYRFGTGDPGFDDAGVFLRQYEMAHSCANVRGGVIFRAADFFRNGAGIADSIAAAYSTPAPLPEILALPAQSPESNSDGTPDCTPDCTPKCDRSGTPNPTPETTQSPTPTPEQ